MEDNISLYKDRHFGIMIREGVHTFWKIIQEIHDDIFEKELGV